MFNLFKVIFPSSNKMESTPIVLTTAEEKLEQVDKSIQSAAFKKRGNAYLANGELENAAQCYQQAIEVYPDYADAHLNLGFVLKEQKLYEKASHALRRAILLNSTLEDAYYFLGEVSLELGDVDEAINNFNTAIKLKADFEQAYRELCRALLQNSQIDKAKTTLLKAISLFPYSIDFPYNLGKLYAHEGAADKAIDYFQKTLALKPDFSEVYNDLGLILQQQGKLEAAIHSFQGALSIKPDYAEAHANLGFGLHKQGKLDVAISSYLAALSLNPNLATVHNNLASVLQAQDKLDDAINHLQKAVTINPSYAEAHSNLGVALKIQGDLDAAVKSCQMALSLNPHNAEAHSNFANALQALGKLDAAVESYSQALALNPSLEETRYNLGSAYIAQGKFDAAVEQYQQAIILKPDFANAHYNLGTAFIELGKWDAANQSYQEAISLNPNLAEAHLNLSLCQLLLGDFERGWAEYEWRWKSTHMKVARFDFTPPLWLGKESLLGKTILLHHEQGFGDTLQFCRYAKLVAALSAKVLLVVPAALKSLLTALEGVDQVLAEGEPLPAFDYHCPLMSLPYAFSTRITNIPTENAYISADSSHVSKWQSRLGHKTHPRIGLVWSGSDTHKNDHNRSISLANLLKLMPDQAHLFSLQKEVRAIDQRVLNAGNNIAHFGEDLKDFMDTAGLIACMDLVISVDTSVAHLAGAMGKPVWVLLPFNPDWRWMLERSNSPWYPSVKLFRQPKMGDWDSVFNKISNELQKTISRRA